MTAVCPICGKRFEVESLAAHPAFPFCSERCRLVDLGRWLDGGYVVPGASAPDVELDESPSQVESEA
jgi:endogenous inhibitor of DNA gyrase (YacG/DUF329 family)